MATSCFLLIPLIAGWMLDKAFGDPLRLPHPIVGFGRLIAWGEGSLNRGKRRAMKGAFLAVGLILSAYGVAWSIVHGVFCLNAWAGIAVASVLVFYCLAGTTLFRACDGSVEEGRRQVARIVGRDTSSLSAQEVRAAALETLAENLSDGVIAPLFWYMLLGVPGMVAYKMVNTLDSMIGYRNERYDLFGRVAARIDDAANFIPARLTAALMILVSGRFSLFSFVKKYGRQHLSPNAGYPEAALAGILDCRFGGAHDYFGKRVEKPYIGANPRELTTDDMCRSVAIASRAEIVTVGVMAAVYSSLLMMA